MLSLFQTFQRYKIEAAFASAIFILLGAGVASYRAIEASRESTAWVDHTYNVIAELDALATAATDVGSGSQGFALTREPSFLHLYESAVADVKSRLQTLRLLTQDNEGQRQKVGHLDQLLSRNIELASGLVAERGDRSGTGSTVPGERIFKARQEFRELAGKLKNEELRLLDQRMQRSNEYFALTEVALAVATLLGVIIAASAGIGVIRDTYRRRKAEADLFEEKERAQVTLGSIGDGVIRTDVKGTISFLNEAAAKLTGWTVDEAQGKHVSEVFRVVDEITKKAIPNRMEIAAREGCTASLPESALLVRRDGGEIPVEDVVNPIHDNEGHVIGAVKVFRDVSAARALASRLQHSAQHDPLTGLSNRVLLGDRISQAVASAARRDAKVAVLYLDLDGFKLINDTLGHAAGDELLKSAADRLRACTRDADTVARLGGDEFVVLLANIAHAEDAALSAERILHALHSVHLVHGRDLHLGASIGISVYPDDASGAEALLANADAAMYEAKASGRRRYVYFPRLGDLDELPAKRMRSKPAAAILNFPR